MSKHVLVVDDEDDIREVAALTLEALAGWSITTASNGEEGFDRAVAERPDAVLLDVMMPGVDGPATFRRLQADERTRSIPVILLTAKVQAADRARFEALGVWGVIAKPFDPVMLPSEVCARLGW